jgi:hypothetical protein
MLMVFSTRVMLDTVTTQPPTVGSSFQKPTMGITVMDSREVSNSSAVLASAGWFLARELSESQKFNPPNYQTPTKKKKRVEPLDENTESSADHPNT